MKEERNFKEVIHAIKGAEKDKDKFCRAARIERQPMSFERYQFTLYFIAGMAAMAVLVAVAWKYGKKEGGEGD